MAGLAVLALAACTEGGAPLPVANMELKVAPMVTDSSIVDACFKFTVYDADNEVYWSKEKICLSQYGDDANGLTYPAAPCPAVDEELKVQLEIQSITAIMENGKRELVEGTDYWDPCANSNCVQDVQCVEDDDTPVLFDLEVVRNAEIGFFDAAVRIDDVFCAGKLDRTYDAAGTRPIQMLPNPAGEGNIDSIVVASACTSGNASAQPITLNATQLTVTCGAPPVKHRLIRAAGNLDNWAVFGFKRQDNLTTGTVSIAGKALENIELEGKTFIANTDVRSPNLADGEVVGTVMAKDLNNVAGTGQPAIATYNASLGKVLYETRLNAHGFVMANSERYALLNQAFEHIDVAAGVTVVDLKDDKDAGKAMRLSDASGPFKSCKYLALANGLLMMSCVNANNDQNIYGWLYANTAGPVPPTTLSPAFAGETQAYIFPTRAVAQMGNVLLEWNLDATDPTVPTITEDIDGNAITAIEFLGREGRLAYITTTSQDGNQATRVFDSDGGAMMVISEQSLNGQMLGGGQYLANRTAGPAIATFGSMGITYQEVLDLPSDVVSFDRVEKLGEIYAVFGTRLVNGLEEQAVFYVSGGSAPSYLGSYAVPTNTISKLQDFAAGATGLFVLIRGTREGGVTTDLRVISSTNDGEDWVGNLSDNLIATSADAGAETFDLAVPEGPQLGHGKFTGTPNVSNYGVWYGSTQNGTPVTYLNAALALKPGAKDCRLKWTVYPNEGEAVKETDKTQIVPLLSYDVKLTDDSGAWATTVNPLNGKDSQVRTAYTKFGVSQPFCYGYDGAFDQPKNLWCQAEK